MNHKHWGSVYKIILIVMLFAFVLMLISMTVWSFRQSVEFVAPIFMSEPRIAGVEMKLWAGAIIQFGQTVFFTVGGLAGGIDRKNVIGSPATPWYLAGIVFWLADMYTNIGMINSMSWARADIQGAAYFSAITVSLAEEAIAAIVATIAHMIAEVYEDITGKRAPKWLSIAGQIGSSASGRNALRGGTTPAPATRPAVQQPLPIRDQSGQSMRHRERPTITDD